MKSATMVRTAFRNLQPWCRNSCQVYTWQEMENTFRREKEAGRSIVNRVSGFSLAELLSGKKRSFSYWALPRSWGMRAPPADFSTPFNFFFVFFFITSFSKTYNSKEGSSWQEFHSLSFHSQA